ncbi:MAG: YceD family protein [Myxococcaceae bacterium]
MLVKIEEIQAAGLELNEPMPASLVTEALAGAPEAGFVAERGFTLKARLTKVSGGVLLSARFSVAIKAPCKRCVDEVHLEVPVDFTLSLVPKPRLGEPPRGGEDDGRAPQAGSFVLEAADEEPFDGKRIDLDPILREQILLALPVSVVCREECKGLCPMCGGELNERECGCERKVPDPRLAALKDIKLS